ncbi:MAG: AAA family ATPase [Solirubrobacterales bacterium]
MPSVSSTLIGRERELAVLADALAGSRRSGRVVVVEGEAGVGKTVLLAALGEAAVEDGGTVLRARGGELERGEGFGIARRLLERVVAEAVEGDRDGLLEGAAAHALGVFGRGNDVMLDEGARYGLYWLVANLAEAAPLAILVDDAQWADVASLDWLAYLARRLDGLPVLLAVGVRAGDPGAAAPALEAIRAEPTTAVLRPASLDPAGTADLAARLWGQPVGDDFAAACHAWTGGNPHYVSEVVAGLRADGHAPGDGAVEWMRRGTPERLSTLTRQRLARLSEPAVALAGAVAVLAGGARLDRAAELAGLDPDAAAAAADELARARVLEPATEALGFVHPLVAGAVYEDLPAARRGADHRRAAALLDAEGGAAEPVAAQLLRVPPASDEWALGRLLAAAGEALAHGSAASAAALLERARDEPPPPARAAEVLGMLGMAEALEGRPDGRAHLAEAAALSEDPGARAGLALAGARFQLIAGEAAAAVALLRSALDGLGPEPSDQRLRLEAALITVARSDPSLAAVAAAHLDAVGDAAELPTPGGRLVAVQLAFAQASAGDPAALTAATARTALGDGVLLDENPLAPDAFVVPISVLSICDELDEAAGWYERAAARVRERGEPFTYATVAALAARTAFLRGRLDEAEVLARDALRIAAGAPALGVVEAFAGAHLAAVLRERGELDAALALTGAALGDGSPAAAAAGDLLFAHGAALLVRGDAEAAAEALLACGRHQELAGIRNPAFVPWRSAASAALARLGRDAEAAALAAAEVELAATFGAARPLGIALRGRGLLAGGDRGLADLEASVAALDGSAAVLELAHSQVALGAALRRGGHRADARRPLADGLATAERCGADLLAAAARTELRASGARRRTGDSYDPDALTVAERRVCEMAADGMRNREIAQALFVTRGTVESQLHVAYRKLGITGRGELPRRARQSRHFRNRSPRVSSHFPAASAANCEHAHWPADPRRGSRPWRPSEVRPGRLVAARAGCPLATRRPGREASAGKVTQAWERCRGRHRSSCLP